jgi:hypothetical protein
MTCATQFKNHKHLFFAGQHGKSITITFEDNSIGIVHLQQPNSQAHFPDGKVIALFTFPDFTGHVQAFRVLHERLYENAVDLRIESCEPVRIGHKERNQRANGDDNDDDFGDKTGTSIFLRAHREIPL